jgi:hypothetical protein
MDTNQTPIDSATQVDIINRLATRLKSCYVFPKVAEQICAHLQVCLHDGAYKDLNDGNLFALALTINLQDVNHDEHLWVRWHAKALPDDEGSLHLNQTWQQAQQKEAAFDNFGIHRLERLPGNVGYVDIRYFYRPAWGGDAIAAAMTFIAHTQALIIDLRQCTGGFPEMIALMCSYLFGEEPIHLVSIFWRDENFTQEYWTFPDITISKLVDKPIYLLTSKVTFSGGEMFATILQNHQRATVIGEKTDGGAHPGTSYRIHPHFEAFIPVGRTIDPISGSNWEGSGVTPDIPISAELSFDGAYMLALRSILANQAVRSDEVYRKMADEAQNALKALE